MWMNWGWNLSTMMSCYSSSKWCWWVIVINEKGNFKKNIRSKTGTIFVQLSTTIWNKIIEKKSNSTKVIIEVNEQSMVECLKRLKEQGTDKENLYENLRPHGTITPRLHGLPKIHKQGIAVRPILDMFNSPYHATWKWLTQLLIPVCKRLCTYSLRDSFDFIQRIENLNTSEKIMLSYNVSSPFTSILLIETVTCLCNYIENEHMNIELSTRNLKELILRCNLSIVFRFNNVM